MSCCASLGNNDLKWMLNWSVFSSIRTFLQMLPVSMWYTNLLGLWDQYCIYRLGCLGPLVTRSSAAMIVRGFDMVLFSLSVNFSILYHHNFNWIYKIQIIHQYNISGLNCFPKFIFTFDKSQPCHGWCSGADNKWLQTMPFIHQPFPKDIDLLIWI